MKDDTKIFWFIKFHTELWLVQSYCVLDKDIFACLFSIHNIISLSCHAQVLVHDMINLLYYCVLGFIK